MITFGIVTDGNSPHLSAVCQSIDKTMAHHRWFDYEILIVGLNARPNIKNTRCIAFDSKNNPGWITRKKNIITQEAKYDTIVYTHDYVSFDEAWLIGWGWFSRIGGAYMWPFSNVPEEFDIGMNVLLTQDGYRFRDWCAWDDPRYGHPWTQHEPWCPPEGMHYQGKPCLVPYDYKHTKRMYISGTYWVAKRHVMVDNPLDENLRWGQAEDIKWSLQVRDKYKYVMNTHSVCRLLKPKDVILPYVELSNEL